MKKSIKGYAVYISAMILLVITALFLPQIIFNIQDRYRMASTKVEKREHIVFAQMNTNYETEMYDRMKVYATIDRKNINVTAIEYDISYESEVHELAEKVFNQEWLAAFHDITLCYFYDVFEKSIQNLTDCKKYIVYGNDYQQGLALMIWYLEFYQEENNIRIQLLMDAETESIYYITVTAFDEIVYDAKYQKDGAMAYSVSNNEEMYFMTEQLMEHMDFYSAYYGGSRIVSEENVYVDEQKCTFESPFYYETLTLNFEFQADHRKGMWPDISMGISEIKNIIPEMIQN